MVCGIGCCQDVLVHVHNASKLVNTEGLGLRLRPLRGETFPRVFTAPEPLRERLPSCADGKTAGSSFL